MDKEQGKDLAKGGGLHGHFKAMAAHHNALADLHKVHHEFTKAKHDSMEDGDMHKAYFGKVAEHHLAKHALHKAHADHAEGMAAAHVPEGETMAAAACG